MRELKKGEPFVFSRRGQRKSNCAGSSSQAVKHLPRETVSHGVHYRRRPEDHRADGEIKYQLNKKFTPGPGETQKEVDDRASSQKKWFQNSSVVAICTRSGDAGTGWLAVENMSLAAVAEAWAATSSLTGTKGKKRWRKYSVFRGIMSLPVC